MERDGCGCPPWVLRCVHFDGRILLLLGYQLDSPECARCVPPSQEEFQCGSIRGDWDSCPECGEPRLYDQTLPGVTYHNTEAEGREAFDKAEEVWAGERCLSHSPAEA